jgi:signal transduction histidine kinase/DNA-binding response OmpR family regulator/streptogramin lyase
MRRARLSPRAFLLLLTWLLTAPVHAAPVEEARFARFAIQDGLSQNSVSALVQDHHGFLWVGTQDGLNRFDGYEFKVYRPDVDDPGAISDGMVTALALDGNGGLWVGTRHGGLNYYLRREERFVTYRAGPGGPAGNYITNLLVARDGLLWVATSEGVSRRGGGPRTDSFETVFGRRAFGLAEGPDGAIWIGADDGTLHVYRKGTLTEVPLGAQPGRGTGVTIRTILADRPGEVWIGTHSTELIRLGGAGIVTRYTIGPADETDPGRIRSLARDPDGGLWIGGLSTGLVYFDPARNLHITFREQPQDPHGLSHDDILSLLVDRERALWVGTLSGGLNRLLLGTTGFTHHRHQPGVAGSLSHNIVTAFARTADGAIWVGTDGGGINSLDPRTGRFGATRMRGGAADGLARVWALHADQYGALWAGTWGAGLNVRWPGATEFDPLATMPAQIITAIAEDANSLWVGSTDGGLARLGHGGELLAHYLPAPQDPHGLQDRHVTSLWVDGDGSVWLGSWSSGLARLTPGDGRFIHFRHFPEAPAGVPHDRIRALARARDGTLWLGTGAGLARFDDQQERIEHFGGRHGLPPGTVYGIVEDADGRLWLSTNMGLLRYDPVRASTRVFTPAEGVQEYEFNGGAYLALPDGRALFGGINGFNIVEPQAIRPAHAPPKVVITDFLLFGRPVRPSEAVDNPGILAAASELESLRLPHRYNMLSFRFAAPLPVAPRQLRYAYRLEGFDDDWRIASAGERSAVYTNLAPGRYLLRVRAAGADDLWSEEDRVVELRILPPWWRSAPAYFAYLLALLLAITALVQWRTYALRRRTEMLRAQVRERTRRLAEQKRLIEDQARHLSQALEGKEALFARVSHEFRTPLTLIVGPIETLLADERRGRTAQWLRLMRRNARRLLALVDQLLGLSRLAGQEPLALSPQNLAAVVRGTVAAFDSLAVRKSIALSAEPVEDGWVSATPELIERIVTNLVSNAIKYTPEGGRVQVALRHDAEMLWLSVSDDGPGIPPEDQAAVFEPFHRLSESTPGSGIGLAVVRESAVALGGSVTLDSAPGEGSTFSVRLPQCPAPRRETGAEDESPPAAHMLLEAEALAEQLELARAPAPGPAATVEDTRPHILVVEDSADLRILLFAALEPNYRCSEATDGQAGIATALEAVPDLVISDVMMPGADGFEVTRTLKQDPRTSHVPVILLTALGDRASRLQGLEEHADDYLVKPFDAEELRLRVRNLLESRQILRQRAGTQVYGPDARLLETGAAQPALHGPRERQFLERLREAVASRYVDPETSVAVLAGAVAMTERQLQRKLKSLLNLTPGEYLREFRLQKAAAQLAEGVPAGVVAFDCGFSSQSHFGSCFKARFGLTPGEYQAGQGNPPAQW